MSNVSCNDCVWLCDVSNRFIWLLNDKEGKKHPFQQSLYATIQLLVAAYNCKFGLIWTGTWTWMLWSSTAQPMWSSNTLAQAIFQILLVVGGVDCTLFRGAILSQTMQSRLPLINPLLDTGIDNSSLCSHWKVASQLLFIRINIIREQDFFKLILLSFIQRRKILLFSRFMSLR